MISNLNEIDWRLELSQFYTQEHMHHSECFRLVPWSQVETCLPKWRTMGTSTKPSTCHYVRYKQNIIHIVYTLNITSTPTEARAVVFGLRMSHEVHIQGLPPWLRIRVRATVPPNTTNMGIFDLNWRQLTGNKNRSAFTISCVAIVLWKQLCSKHLKTWNKIKPAHTQ